MPIVHDRPTLSRQAQKSIMINHILMYIMFIICFLLMPIKIVNANDIKWHGAYIITIGSGSWESVAEYCKKFGLGNHVAGCAGFDLKDKKCIIMVPDGFGLLQLRVIGHEVLHCMYGNWHD